MRPAGGDMRHTPPRPASPRPGPARLSPAAAAPQAPPPATAAPAPAPAARRVWIGPDWLTLLEATAAPDAEAVDPRFSAAPAPALPAPCAAAEVSLSTTPPHFFWFAGTVEGVSKSNA